MSKRTKKTHPKCQQYQFYLKPLHNHCKFNQLISLSFCDSSKHKRNKNNTEHNHIKCFDYPLFNRDNNHATPTFILHSQKQHFSQKGQKLRTQHQKKMIEYTDQKDSLNLPKPRSKNSFCNVCRQIYDDYLNHILSENHKKCIKNSNFNRSILQLVEKFNPSHKNSYNFIQNTLSTQDDDDVQILYCKPKKKIKPVDQNHQFNNQQLNNQIGPPPHLNMSNATYFPNTQSGFLRNPVVYGNYFPFQNFQAVEINFNNRQMIPNQVNYSYPIQNYGMMNGWPQYMGQYPKNLYSYHGLNQQNQIYPQNHGYMGGFTNNLGVFGQQNIGHNGIGFYQNMYENMNRGQVITVQDDENMNEFKRLRPS